MKKILFLLAAAILFLMPQQLFAGNIVFWNAMTEDQNKIVQDLSAKYHEKNPSINIETKRFASQEELYNALMSSDKNSLPDLAAIDAGWQGDLIGASKLLPVEDYILKSVKIALKMDTYAPLWKGSVYADKLYSLPYFAYNYALVYDADAFAAHGIKTPPANRAQLFKYASKLTDKAAGKHGFYVPINASARYMSIYFNNFVSQADTEGKTVCEKGLDGKSAEKDVFFLKDMLYTHNVASHEHIKNAAMFFGTPEDLINASGNGRNLKVVRWTGKNKEPNICLTNLAIMDKAGANPEETWFFIYYLAEFPQLQKLALNSPVLPANKQVTLSPDYFQRLEKYPGLRMFLTLMGKGYVVGMSKQEILSKNYGSAIKAALSNKKDVKKAVEEAMDVINPVILPIEEPSRPTGVNSNTY
ncbi:MAG: extracellular solute-binding protein [bacterium]|nr:extracellular solute-binding protein [bacterium]